MLIIRTITLLSVAPQDSSYALPRDVLGSVEPSALNTRQDDAEDQDYNVMTRIGSFKGCSDDQAHNIRQAWKDAMMIASAIGDPFQIKPTSWLFREFFGDYKHENPTWEEDWELVKGTMPYNWNFTLFLTYLVSRKPGSNARADSAELVARLV